MLGRRWMRIFRLSKYHAQPFNWKFYTPKKLTLKHIAANFKETKIRQARARTLLWDADNQNYKDLKNIKVPVLVADGREDVIDNPKNSVVIANQIPFAWLAFYEGGYAFLFQSYKKLSETVNVFLQKD